MLCSLPQIRLYLRLRDLGDLVGGQADNPNSPERSKIWWIGKLRRKMELRQLCARPEYVAAVASR
jgi:hypothetical protein